MHGLFRLFRKTSNKHLGPVWTHQFAYTDPLTVYSTGSRRDTELAHCMESTFQPWNVEKVFSLPVWSHSPPIPCLVSWQRPGRLPWVGKPVGCEGEHPCLYPAPSALSAPWGVGWSAVPFPPARQSPWEDTPLYQRAPSTWRCSRGGRRWALTPRRGGIPQEQAPLGW